MVDYQPRLKPLARQLRNKQTSQEQILWHYLRKKQIQDVQFFRQRPLGKYIVDFYAPTVRLVIEVDGIQHYAENNQLYDAERDKYLKHIGLTVLRFNNLEVSCALESVMQIIEHTIQGKPVVVEHGKLIEM